MDRSLLRELARTCLEDRRLLDIVRNVASMEEEEREEFKRKVSMYFMNRASEVDVEAYRFFKLILEGENASEILAEVKVLESGGG